MPQETPQSDVPWPRAIAHLDLDQFFAAVEILDFPELKGKPVIVGGTPGKRGVVSTASYEARQFGVHSAMPSTQADRLCPQGIWRRPRMKRYVAKSKEVRSIFDRYTDQIEPISIDEAFLDLTGSQRLFGSPEQIGRRMKREILEETELVVSVGIAENKFLAKIASDLKKPDGFVIVPQGRAASFLAPLPIKRLWGAGPKTCSRLQALGLHTIGDIAQADVDWLNRRVGEQASAHLHRLARGVDERDVDSGGRPKSIGKENTFSEDLRNAAGMERELLGFAEDVSSRLRARGLRCGGLTLKVRLGDFSTMTRAYAFEDPTDLAEHLYRAAVQLLRTRVDLKGKGVRLLGIAANRLMAPGEWTESLFPDEKDQKRRQSAQVIDGLRKRFGSSSVTRGGLLEPPEETTGSAPS